MEKEIVAIKSFHFLQLKLIYLFFSNDLYSLVETTILLTKSLKFYLKQIVEELSLNKLLSCSYSSTKTIYFGLSFQLHN
jgi:hypothetical protein